MWIALLRDCPPSKSTKGGTRETRKPAQQATHNYGEVEEWFDLDKEMTTFLRAADTGSVV
ncbi:hypothetical protein [Edaphobacter bradus]|uniref:hypothetical protein n=1 Tax=Edaphobacter bradus TaxID=2259016 RepID=UPI0021E01A1A|nr:hypothetical protein [Edaphobacter bradus]